MSYIDEATMDIYKFNTKVSKEGIIKIPEIPELHDNEVEVTIRPKEADKDKKTDKADQFLKKWTGFLAGNSKNIDDARYEYLIEKHR